LPSLCLNQPPPSSASVVAIQGVTLDPLLGRSLCLRPSQHRPGCTWSECASSRVLLRSARHGSTKTAHNPPHARKPSHVPGPFHETPPGVGQGTRCDPHQGDIGFQRPKRWATKHLLVVYTALGFAASRTRSISLALSSPPLRHAQAPPHRHAPLASSHLRRACIYNVKRSWKSTRAEALIVGSSSSDAVRFAYHPIATPAAIASVP
jgi:hypothetical protein